MIAVAGDGQVWVYFTPPDDPGFTITSFIATATPGGATANGNSPIAMTGLTNGTSYTFTVKAVNAAGSSAESASSNAVTPQPANTQPASLTLSTNTPGVGL